ncbi:zf-HC2 domain-containing protein [Hymenobacter koreensis]|uniref:Putative zinc-finger domain-containing protein n=1 Tax=Hymenobacter koreensis TaxID=1084523 RepID=A0ABP8IWP6_9BACT
MEAKFMKCESVQQGLMDWLANELPAPEHEAVAAHLAQCPACQQELLTARQLWQTMGALPVPEPSEQMRPRFYSMLAEAQAAEQRKQQYSVAALVERLRAWWQPEYAMRLAYGVALLVIGLAGGYLLKGNTTTPLETTQQPMAAASIGEPENIRQTQLLTLLENPSAVQRLRAVSYAEELAPSNERVVVALLSTLNYDPNVNVRLATLEVLATLTEDPTVRQGLVRSMARQESPLVQSAMADVMVQLQERRSVRPMQKLLQQENLNEQVKTKIEESIQTLSNGRQQAEPQTPPQSNENRSHIQSGSDTSVAT